MGGIAGRRERKATDEGPRTAPARVAKRVSVRDTLHSVGIEAPRELFSLDESRTLVTPNPVAFEDSLDWCVDRGTSIDAMKTPALRAAIARGPLPRTTKVWCDGMDCWAPADEIDELCLDAHAVSTPAEESATPTPFTSEVTNAAASRRPSPPEPHVARNRFAHAWPMIGAGVGLSFAVLVALRPSSGGGTPATQAHAGLANAAVARSQPIVRALFDAHLAEQAASVREGRARDERGQRRRR